MNLDSPSCCRKGSGPMDLCANIFFEKYVFVLNAIWQIVRYFLQLNSYLIILKYPKFSSCFLTVSIEMSLKKCKILLNSPKYPKKFKLEHWLY